MNQNETEVVTGLFAILGILIAFTVIPKFLGKLGAVAALAILLVFLAIGLLSLAQGVVGGCLDPNISAEACRAIMSTAP